MSGSVMSDATVDTVSALAVTADASGSRTYSSTNGTVLVASGVLS